MNLRDPALLLAIAPLGGLAADVVVSIALRQALASLNYLFAMLGAFAAGLAAQGLATAVALTRVEAPADAAGYLALNALAYCALGFGYFTFANLGATSLRIRVLRLILVSPQERCTAESIARIYDVNEMVDARLERLLGWRQLRRQGDRYVAVEGTIFRRLHAVVQVLRRLVYGRARR